MDNSINTNLAFKANLVTKLKGNKNIMKPIAEEFAKITQKTPGEFIIRRASEPAKAHLKDFEYKSASIVTTLFNDDFAMDPEKIGQKGIKAIARKLADVFYSLKAEDKYNTKINSYAEEIYNLKQRINKLSPLKVSADKLGFRALGENYAKTIEKCNQEINAIKQKVTTAQKSFMRSLNKYQDNEVVDLQASVVSDDFGYDFKWALRQVELKKKANIK